MKSQVRPEISHCFPKVYQLPNEELCTGDEEPSLGDDKGHLDVLCSSPFVPGHTRESQLTEITQLISGQTLRVILDTNLAMMPILSVHFLRESGYYPFIGNVNSCSDVASWRLGCGIAALSRCVLGRDADHLYG